jgi:hypothetical protein
MTSYQYVTLDEKIAIINDHADGARLSQPKLCKNYKMSEGAVYSILQRKDKYKDDFKMNANTGFKRKLQDDSDHKIDETEVRCLLFTH